MAASIVHPVYLSRGMSYVLEKTGWKIEPALQTHIKAHPERDMLAGWKIDFLLLLHIIAHPEKS